MGLLKRRIIEVMEPKEEPPTDRNDIVYRLQSVMSDLDAEERDEAASEIARLRLTRLRLTDAEREAVEWAVKFAGMSDCNGRRLATLRGLLERTQCE